MTHSEALARPFPYPPLREEWLPGGGHGSFILRRGHLLRITDIDGGANVSTLMFNAFEKTERLNLPDSLKCQHTAKLTRGHCLYSDMGRVLAAITEDTAGWNDSLGGVLDASEVREKYGSGPYQTLHNAYHRNGTDSLLVELGKWGLGLEDLLMVLNLFSKVIVDPVGRMHFVPGNSRAGDYIEVFAPMDVLVVMSALQHPMDPSPTYQPRPLRLTWMRADAAIADHCRTSRPENERGFINTENLYL